MANCEKKKKSIFWEVEARFWKIMIGFPSIMEKTVKFQKTFQDGSNYSEWR